VHPLLECYFYISHNQTPQPQPTPKQFESTSVKTNHVTFKQTIQVTLFVLRCDKDGNRNMLNDLYVELYQRQTKTKFCIF